MREQSKQYNKNYCILRYRLEQEKQKKCSPLRKSSEISTPNFSFPSEIRVGNLKLHNFVPPIVDAFISCKDQSIAAHAAPLLQLECPHQYSGKIRTCSVFWLKKCRPQLSVIWCLATWRIAIRYHLQQKLQWRPLR